MEASREKTGNINMSMTLNELNCMLGPMVKDIVRAEFEKRDESIKKVVDVVNEHSSRLNQVRSHMQSVMRVHNNILERLERMDQDRVQTKAEMGEKFQIIHHHCCELDQEIFDMELSVQKFRTTLLESIKSTVCSDRKAYGLGVEARVLYREERCSSFSQKFIRARGGVGLSNVSTSDVRSSPPEKRQRSHHRSRDHDEHAHRHKRRRHAASARVPFLRGSGPGSVDDDVPDGQEVDGELLSSSKGPPNMLNTPAIVDDATNPPVAALDTAGAGGALKTPTKPKRRRPPLTGAFH